MAALALTASAQKDLVKQVGNSLKGSKPDYAAALKAIEPALTNPETAELQETWNLVGKAGIGIYDAVFLKESMQQGTSKEEKLAGGQAFIKGYKALDKAARLADEKGKMPGKKSKDIIKELAGLYPQTKNAGIFLLQSGDYDGAYDAWELYINAPSNDLFGNLITPDAPDVQGQFLFYQAIAMLSKDKNDVALEKLKATVPSGYESIDVYRYGIEAANRLNDTIDIYDFARKGYEKYGTQDIIFIGQLINSCLESNDYAKANTYLTEALAQTPDSMANIKSQLFDIKGNVDEQSGNLTAALESFDKAIATDPAFAKGYFDKARIIYNTAIKEDEKTDANAQSRNVTDELKEAAELFKKAYELDSEGLHQIPGILYRLYYRLGAGYEDDAKYWEGMQ